MPKKKESKKKTQTVNSKLLIPKEIIEGSELAAKELVPNDQAVKIPPSPTKNKRKESKENENTNEFLVEYYKNLTATDNRRKTSTKDPHEKFLYEIDERIGQYRNFLEATKHRKTVLLQEIADIGTKLKKIKTKGGNVNEAEISEMIYKMRENFKTLDSIPNLSKLESQIDILHAAKIAYKQTIFIQKYTNADFDYAQVIAQQQEIIEKSETVLNQEWEGFIDYLQLRSGKNSPEITEKIESGKEVSLEAVIQFKKNLVKKSQNQLKDNQRQLDKKSADKKTQEEGLKAIRGSFGNRSRKFFSRFGLIASKSKEEILLEERIKGAGKDIEELETANSEISRNQVIVQESLSEVITLSKSIKKADNRKNPANFSTEFLQSIKKILGTNAIKKVSEQHEEQQRDQDKLETIFHENCSERFNDLLKSADLIDKGLVDRGQGVNDTISGTQKTATMVLSLAKIINEYNPVPGVQQGVGLVLKGTEYVLEKRMESFVQNTLKFFNEFSPKNNPLENQDALNKIIQNIINKSYEDKLSELTEEGIKVLAESVAQRIISLVAHKEVNLDMIKNHPDQVVELATANPNLMDRMLAQAVESKGGEKVSIHGLRSGKQEVVIKTDKQLKADLEKAKFNIKAKISQHFPNMNNAILNDIYNSIDKNILQKMEGRDKVNAKEIKAILQEDVGIRTKAPKLVKAISETLDAARDVTRTKADEKERKMSKAGKGKKAMKRVKAVVDAASEVSGVIDELKEGSIDALLETVDGRSEEATKTAQQARNAAKKLTPQQKSETESLAKELTKKLAKLQKDCKKSGLKPEQIFTLVTATNGNALSNHNDKASKDQSNEKFEKFLKKNLTADKSKSKFSRKKKLTEKSKGKIIGDLNAISDSLEKLYDLDKNLAEKTAENATKSKKQLKEEKRSSTPRTSVATPNGLSLSPTQDRQIS